MTPWERRIIGVFADRYPASAAAVIFDPPGREGDGAYDEKPRPLRLRPDRIFHGFDHAPPDERESFLEAAEALEKRGLLSLTWVRRRKGEALSSLTCRNPELLFELAGGSSPKTAAEAVRRTARTLAESGAGETEFFSFLAEKFTPLDAVRGVDAGALEDLARLTGALSEKGELKGPLFPKTPRGITTRALSVSLYRDSKRLEAQTGLFKPLLNRARRQGIEVPDFSFLDRAFPETFIAGKITLSFGGEGPPAPPPVINLTGSVLALPLGTILKLRRIIPPATSPAAVLMIENKETFFALAETLPDYSCFLYTGGHPNRAVQALVSLLAESGFAFYHAGDLDPDGILILQELKEIAGKPVKPLKMDRDTFNRYLDCGRKLKQPSLRRLKLIREGTRSIPGMEDLIGGIEEAGVGIEQEIIDYRG
ncbi:MAG: DUF2220 domain-containing protein [Treponema sp.]|nr:DUF2220 domain-containing protein [Treponema sp.]